jgi:hypothetical protein
MTSFRSHSILWTRFDLVCTAAMHDEKKSSLFIKEGIKQLQKRSNPIELFVQKRVNHIDCVSNFT